MIQIFQNLNLLLEQFEGCFRFKWAHSYHFHSDLSACVFINSWVYSTKISRSQNIGVAKQVWAYFFYSIVGICQKILGDWAKHFFLFNFYMLSIKKFISIKWIWMWKCSIVNKIFVRAIFDSSFIVLIGSSFLQ